MTIAAIAIAMLFPREMGASTINVLVVAPTCMDFVMSKNPKLTIEEGWWIAYWIDQKAKEYGLDPKLFGAIIAQESTFKVNAKRCHGNGNCDYGLGQINIQWVKKWRLDKKRLLKDPAYNLDVAAKILRSAINEGESEPNAYSRYHNPARKFRLAYEYRIQKQLAFF